jgi:hypothetical protein
MLEKCQLYFIMYERSYKYQMTALWFYQVVKM